MPPRLSPTVRQQRLGLELRRMREYAGMTPRAMAAELGTDAPKVSQMENGKSGISVDRLHAWAAASKCTNTALIDGLALMARDRGKKWWDNFREQIPTGFLDIAEMEHHATSLVVLNTTFIPGLLQTTGYAAGVFARIRPPLPRHATDIRVAFRVQRQNLLTNTDKPYVAFVHETSLRMQFGGPAVLREQLASLLEHSERPGITIRVIPFEMDTFPGAGENLYLACGAIPELDTVQYDLAQGPQFVHSGAELHTYREIITEADSSALSPSKSRDFIHRTMHDLKG
ncbi:helix-turn-helix domain-containing protein [Kitasatospora sp. NPDC003701]